MSGGSQRHLYSKVRDVTEDLFVRDQEIDKNKVEKVKEVYRSISELLHSVEWVESGDCGHEKLDEALAQFKTEINNILKE